MPVRHRYRTQAIAIVSSSPCRRQKQNGSKVSNQISPHLGVPPQATTAVNRTRYMHVQRRRLATRWTVVSRSCERALGRPRRLGT